MAPFLTRNRGLIFTRNEAFGFSVGGVFATLDGFFIGLEKSGVCRI